MNSNNGINTSDTDKITNGIKLTQVAYKTIFSDYWGNAIIVICVLFFAFTAIIDWYYFGLANVK